MASEAAKKVAEEVLGTLGKGKRPNITKIAIKHGYTPKTANSGAVQNTKTYREIVEKHLSDEKLAKLHEKFLQKKEVVIVGTGRGESEFVFTGQPHSDALKALETAYKLKGRYAELGNTTNNNVQINILSYEPRSEANNNPAPVHSEELPTTSPS